MKFQPGQKEYLGQLRVPTAKIVLAVKQETSSEIVLKGTIMS